VPIFLKETVRQTKSDGFELQITALNIWTWTCDSAGNGWQFYASATIQVIVCCICGHL